ncbi:unnamed protein product [Acanthoscelides obtectus]|uniref:Uncharacterized protein n=1 Tax=Acanthoscelides obtectus TaxID=200917 RepID=A0A9P0M6S6_ACAOB|nr:unnamed protein product [Acanthoscelides obtectus]CAK1641717.1 hypothetical protein AOBTE_LOCUS12582 [Acanthoscelides obtectus]
MSIGHSDARQVGIQSSTFDKTRAKKVERNTKRGKKRWQRKKKLVHMSKDKTDRLIGHVEGPRKGPPNINVCGTRCRHGGFQTEKLKNMLVDKMAVS